VVRVGEAEVVGVLVPVVVLLLEPLIQRPSRVLVPHRTFVPHRSVAWPQRVRPIRILFNSKERLHILCHILLVVRAWRQAIEILHVLMKGFLLFFLAHHWHLIFFISHHLLSTINKGSLGNDGCLT